MSDNRGPGIEHLRKRNSKSTKDTPNKRCQKQDPRVTKLRDNFASSIASISNEFEDVLKIQRNLVSNHIALIAASEWRYSARCVAAAVKIISYEQDKCLETINPWDWNIIDCVDTDLVVFNNPFGTQSYDDQKSRAMNIVLDKIKQYFAVEQEGHWTDVIIVTHKGCLDEYKKHFDHDLLQNPIVLHSGPKDASCTASETSDPVHRNLLEQSQCYIEQYKEQFASQAIYSEAGNHLQQRRLVVISGGRLSRRNDLAMCLIPSHELSRVLILTEADELKHVHFEDTFAVVILDLGGKPNFDQSEASKWYRKFDMLYAATRQGKVNVIITFDAAVLETWLESSLPEHKMLDHVINIGNGVQYDTRTTEGPELPTESQAVVKLETLVDEDNFASSIASISNEFEDVLKIQRNLVSNHIALIAASEWRYSARCVAAAVKIISYEQDKCLETINPWDWNIIDCVDTDLVVFNNPFGTQSYDDQKSRAMNIVLDKIKQYFAVEQEGHWTDVIIVTHKGCLDEYKKHFDHDLLQNPIVLHSGPKDASCTASETSDPVHRNLLEQSQCYIEQYKEQFASQAIYSEAGNHLQQRRLVVISGGRLSRRNDLAMCLIPSHELSRVLILTEADELKHVHFEDTFAVVILDLGGKPNFDQSEASKWYRKFDMLYAATRQGKVNVIITFDAAVLETWLESSLPEHKMLDHVINIGNGVQYDTRTTEGPELPTESQAVVKLETLVDEDCTAESSGVAEQAPSTETTFRRPIKAEFQGTYDIHLPTDRSVCDIWDICMLLNGSFLLTDFSNRMVKKMDQTFNITDSLAVPGQPIGVCQVDKNTAAIALWDKKKILLISLKEKMSVSTSFDVGDNCSGVACSEDLLYVSCGGKGKSGSKKGEGHLEVFDFHGTQIASYYRGFSCPEYVYFNNATSYAYITDATNGLIIEKDDEFKTRKYNYLESPAGICSLNSIQLCIAGYSSNNVMVVNNVLQEDSYCYELLPYVKEPAGLCFDEAHSRLIVTRAKSNVIDVYDLTINDD